MGFVSPHSTTFSLLYSTNVVRHNREGISIPRFQEHQGVLNLITEPERTNDFWLRGARAIESL
jgi:hypothetical protein